MSHSRTALGDSHNFGRRVTLCDGRILKPRTVLWEQLLLAAASPLRRLLDAAAKRDGLGGDAFAFLPDLQFSAADEPGYHAVESVRLAPLETQSSDDRRALATIVGRSLALWSWLGVADLHWENLVLGVDARGSVIFSPLDIEIIFADLSLPTETKLLPDADPEVAAICRHACGVRRVLPYLGKPVDAASLLAMAAAYHQVLAFLDRQGREIAAVFTALPGLRETPIRVCLRGTDEYVRARTEPLWPPLLDAEREQLDRGDIPYFFRLYDRPGIHYYGDRSLQKLRRIPMKGDVPQLDPILNLSRGMRSPSRDSLREQGLFAVLAAFDDASLTGRHQDDEIEIEFGDDTFIVTLPGDEELSCQRDLSEFVGSVYLPCQCGEVRSVFVPPVTACEGPHDP